MKGKWEARVTDEGVWPRPFETADPLPSANSGDSASEFAAPRPKTPAQPPTVQLTSLKLVPVTQVWPSEPQHFTPWLLANGDLLSELLGIDVELEQREYKVGKFSLDIIGREVST